MNPSLPSRPRLRSAPAPRLVLFLGFLAAVLAAPAGWAATFHVDAAAGDDTRTAVAAQDPVSPWQTIGRAIGEATLAAGDRIEVAAGTYDAALETFPLTLVDGVELVGAGRDVTTISAPAGVHLFENLNTPLSAATLLSGFTLTWDDSFAGTAAALYFEVASAAMSPSLESNRFVGPAGATSGIAIHTVDTGTGTRSFTPRIRGNELHDLSGGLLAEWNDGGVDAVLSPVVQANTFTELLVAVELAVEELFEGTAAPEINGGNSFADGEEDVIVAAEELRGAGATVTPVISDNLFTGTGSSAILLLGFDFDFQDSSDRLVFSPIVVANEITGRDAQGIMFLVVEAFETVLEIHPLIAGNNVAGIDGHAILVVYGSLDSTRLDSRAMIANNLVTDPSNVAIAVQAGSFEDLFDSLLDINVVGNEITGPGSSGVVVVFGGHVNAHLELDLLVEGNHVGGAGSTGAVVVLDLEDVSSPGRIRIDDNILEGGAEGGLTLVHTDSLAAELGEAYVSGTCNRVTGNSLHGIVDIANDFPTDWGGGGLSPGRNSLHGNGDLDLLGLGTGTTPAESNWWGTTNSAVIAGNVFGAVDFEPFLTGPPGVAVETDLSVILASDDAFPTGPSTGDTFAYTAVAQGTGECGCATAVLTIPLPTNGTLDTASIVMTGEATLLGADASAIVVGLGALSATDVVTVSFDVVAGEGTELSTQGQLSCLADVSSPLEEPTDDPDTAADDDQTVVELLEPPEIVEEIPTLGTWQLLFLGLLLSGAAVVVLGRHG